MRYIVALKKKEEKMEKPILIAILENKERYIKEVEGFFSELNLSRVIPIETVIFRTVREYEKFCNAREDQGLPPVQALISTLFIPYREGDSPDPDGIQAVLSSRKRGIISVLIIDGDSFEDKEYIWVGMFLRSLAMDYYGIGASRADHKKTKDWHRAWDRIERVLRYRKEYEQKKKEVVE